MTHVPSDSQLFAYAGPRQAPRDHLREALCDHFDTLDAHAARLTKRAQNASELKRRLVAAAQAGVLVSEEQVLAACARESSTAARPALEVLAIPTCQARAPLLKRAISSYLNEANGRGRRLRCVIASNDEVRQTSLVNECGSDAATAKRMDYLCYGPSEKRALSELLAAKTGVDRAVVDFALSGNGYSGETIGANRNALLLVNAGERILSVDDDTICEARRGLPVRDDVLAVRSGGDATEFKCSRSIEEAFALTTSADIDVLAAHGAALGARACDVVGNALRSGTPVQLRGACAHSVGESRALVGRVRASLNGVVGDSGMFSAYGLTASRGGARKELLASEAVFRSALESRAVVRQAPAASLCHGGQFMSMFMALDTEEFLPPFPPVFRSEDTVFGCVLMHCDRQAFIMHQPWVLRHEPVGKRAYQRPFDVVRVGAVLMALARLWGRQWTAGSPQTRAASLGRFCRDIAAVPSDDFARTVRDVVRADRVKDVELRELLLAEHGYKPIWWAEHVRREMRVSLDAVTEESWRGEWADYASGQHYGPLQRYVEDWGRLLESWPTLISAARKYRHAIASLGEQG